MSSLRCRCVREARLITTRSSAALQRGRSFHSATTLCDESGPQTPKALGSQSDFNAIKNSPSKPSFIRLTTNTDERGPGRVPQRAPNAPNTPSLRAASNAGPTGPNRPDAPFQIRRVGVDQAFDNRPPPAPGASPRGTRPRVPHNDISGTKPSRETREIREKGRRGNDRGGKRGGRQGGGRNMRDSKPKRDVEMKPRRSEQGQGRGEDHFVEEPETQESRDYYAAEAEKERLGPSFVPDVSEFSLLGSGATTLTGSRDRSELMHRLLSRSASKLQPTNHSWPTIKADDLLRGKTVYFHSEDEARSVQDIIKAMRLRDLEKAATDRKDKEEMPKNVGANLSSFDDIKLVTLSVEDQAKLNGAWLAGTYVAPGAGAGKNASETLKNVWRQTARNGTYLVEDEQKFGKKVASLVPTRAPPAAKPAAKQTVRA